MSKHSSNVGVAGADSIRLGGMRIQDLPIAEAAIAKQQIPIVEDNDRQFRIETILKQAPTQQVDYLEARITEAEQNINRLYAYKGQLQVKVSEYTSAISLCKYRDEEIARIPQDDPEWECKIGELNKRFPPYNVEAMKQQIKRFQDDEERANQVIAQEHEAIAEMRGVLALCRKRDAELRSLGVKIS